MASDLNSGMQRHDFLKLTGAATAFSLTHRGLASAERRVSVIVSAGDPCAIGDPIHWAAGQLRKALVGKGVACDMVQSPEQAAGSAFVVLVARPDSPLAQVFPHADPLDHPEALRLEHCRARGADAFDVYKGRIES